MNLPVKPWEAAGVTGVNASSPLYVPNTDRLHSSAIPFPGSGGGGSAVGSNVSSNEVPPPPPRPNQTRPIYSAYNRGSMMPYSYGGSAPYSSFGGYGAGYSGYSPYSPYSSYGYGGAGLYGNRSSYYNNNYAGEPTFSQLAEESSASAFQSIESFVSAFGSISMMLESTFHALYSSFRAVVGVADHLGRVKQILSALAIFRFFRWMWKRILYLIGISKIKPETIESLWKEATFGDSPEDAQEIFLREPNKPSSWPILMFLGFIFAGPYLMWKLVKSLNLDGSQSERNKAWASGDADHFVAEVKFPFEAASDRELNLRPGQNIRLAPAKFQPGDIRGWALASDGTKIGLVPLNYIKVLGKRTEGSFRRLKTQREREEDSTPMLMQPKYSQAQTQTPRARVRFDLNPKPPTHSSPDHSSPSDSSVEPPSILVKNNDSVTEDENDVSEC